jgi:hypothetical protein
VTTRTQAQRWVIDSIEETVASIEVDGRAMITLPHALLPAGAKEGHVLRVTIEIDEAGTKQAMDASAVQVKRGMDESRKRDKGGDIKL